MVLGETAAPACVSTLLPLNRKNIGLVMAITAVARSGLYCRSRMEAIMHSDIKQLVIRFVVAIGISAVAVSAIGNAVAKVGERPMQDAIHGRYEPSEGGAKLGDRQQLESYFLTPPTRFR
jgi:hypothetical protein